MGSIASLWWAVQILLYCAGAVTLLCMSIKSDATHKWGVLTNVRTRQKTVAFIWQLCLKELGPGRWLVAPIVWIQSMISSTVMSTCMYLSVSYERSLMLQDETRGWCLQRGHVVESMLHVKCVEQQDTMKLQIDNLVKVLLFKVKFLDDRNNEESSRLQWSILRPEQMRKKRFLFMNEAYHRVLPGGLCSTCVLVFDCRKRCLAAGC